MPASERATVYAFSVCSCVCEGVCVHVRVSLENYYCCNNIKNNNKGAQKVRTIMADKKSALAFNSTEFNSQHKHGPTAGTDKKGSTFEIYISIYLWEKIINLTFM